MRLKQSLPNELAEELLFLVKKLFQIRLHSNSPLATVSHFSQIDRASIALLADVLLTSQLTLRKGFDHHVGLKRGECTDNEYTELKTASKQLLDQLNEYPDFLSALIRVRNLPEPHYEDEQWQVLQALLTLLPLLAAHLNIIFKEHNEIDFTAVAEQALLALGDEDNPTDLALYLDHTIHHLLVDEFQDTSIRQYQLLSKLVQNWQTGEHKTLFIVGDPMQSIYRFRAAEVGLFLQAQQQGLALLN